MIFSFFFYYIYIYIYIFAIWEFSVYQTCYLLHSSHIFLPLYICTILSLWVSMTLSLYPALQINTYLPNWITSLIELRKLRCERKKIQGADITFLLFTKNVFPFFLGTLVNILQRKCINTYKYINTHMKLCNSDWDLNPWSFNCDHSPGLRTYWSSGSWCLIIERIQWETVISKKWIYI